jgi:hypothetical protein
MLRAYIDDSRQDDAPGMYVLAGYIADATKWQDFADEWDLVLAGPPKLHHLKTSDMYRLKARNSVFCGWTAEERDARLLALAKITNKYVLASVQTAIRSVDFENILGQFPGDPQLNRPYPFLFYSIMGGIVSRLGDLQIDDKVEFFFDTQGNESKQKLRDGFHEAKLLHQGWLNDRIAGEPEFKNDEDVSPLQAADLMAWHFRRNLVEHAQGKTFESNVWTELLEAPQRITGLWSPSILRWLALRHGLMSRPATIMTLPDPSSLIGMNRGRY